MSPPLIARLGVAGLVACLPVPSAVLAQTQAEPPTVPGAETFASIGLRPGTFVWRSEPVQPGLMREAEQPLALVVSIPGQMLYVFDASRLLAVSTVSTGRRGHPTPTGAFTVLQKQRQHFSNRYDNAPMPYMLRLTWDGVALHAGRIPGYPASHGCIRLPQAFARQLYALIPTGSRVVVTDTIFPPAAPIMPQLTEVLTTAWMNDPPAEMLALGNNDAPVIMPPADPEPQTQAAQDPLTQGSSAIADSSRP